jgi:hypothetical protein
MRSASSYRGAKKRAAREAGQPFAVFNENYARSRHFAAAELERKALSSTPEAAQAALAMLGNPETPAEARRKLGLWAATGGRTTVVSPPIDQAELDSMNEAAARANPADEETVAKKLTLADIDKALEQALTNWQRKGETDPLVLSKPFAARARQLGWVEAVEFVEAKP